MHISDCRHYGTVKHSPPSIHILYTYPLTHTHTYAHTHTLYTYLSQIGTGDAFVEPKVLPQLELLSVSIPYSEEVRPRHWHPGLRMTIVVVHVQVVHVLPVWTPNLEFLLIGVR